MSKPPADEGTSTFPIEKERERVIRSVLDTLRDSIIKLANVDCFHEVNELSRAAMLIKQGLEPSPEPGGFLDGLKAGRPGRMRL